LWPFLILEFYLEDGGRHVLDLVFVLVTIGFFVVGLGYVVVCDRLQMR
jgi:hypothetical protein